MDKDKRRTGFIRKVQTLCIDPCLLQQRLKIVPERIIADFADESRLLSPFA
jgi:hypothetical protein